MKQWVLTSWMKFVPSSSLRLLRYSLSLNSSISRDYSLRRHVNFYHLPWEQLIIWVEIQTSYIRKLYSQCNIYYWNYYNTKCHGITLKTHCHRTIFDTKKGKINSARFWNFAKFGNRSTLFRLRTEVDS